MRLVDSQQMHEMDRYTIEEIGVPGIVLMENAARSWVEAALPYIAKENSIYVFCGSGNNGGDGYSIARNLANRGFDCTVIAVKPPKSEDCIKNANAWVHYGVTIAWDRFLETDFLLILTKSINIFSGWSSGKKEKSSSRFIKTRSTEVLIISSRLCITMYLIC